MNVCMQLYFILALFCITSLVTPGPNNLMIMVSGITHGVRRSLPHYWGICLGFPIMVIAIGLGFSKIFILYPSLHQFIKIIGSVYMLYLAWKIITASDHLNMSAKKKQPLTFLQAVFFQWLNPKGWVMSVAAVSTYTVVNTSLYQQILIIALFFFILALPCIGIWLIGGVALRKYLNNPSHLQMFNWLMGILLALSIMLVFI